MSTFYQKPARKAVILGSSRDSMTAAEIALKLSSYPMILEPAGAIYPDESLRFPFIRYIRYQNLRITAEILAFNSDK